MTTNNGNLFDLTGKVALITGGNGGLGLAMASGRRRATWIGGAPCEGSPGFR